MSTNLNLITLLKKKHQLSICKKQILLISLYTASTNDGESERPDWWTGYPFFRQGSLKKGSCRDVHYQSESDFETDSLFVRIKKGAQEK
jgi:hypothetical protein